MVLGCRICKLFKSILKFRDWSCCTRLCGSRHVSPMVWFKAHLLRSPAESLFGAASQDCVYVIRRLGSRNVIGAVKNGWSIHTFSAVQSSANRAQCWHFGLSTLFGLLDIILLPIIKAELLDSGSDDLNCFGCADSALDEALFFKIATLVITELASTLISDLDRVFAILSPDHAPGKLSFANKRCCLEEIGLDKRHEVTGVIHPTHRSSLELLLVLHGVFEGHLLVSKLFPQDDVLITQRRLSILLLVHKKWLLFGDLGFVGTRLSYLVCNLIAGIFLHIQVWLDVSLLERMLSHRICFFHMSFLCSNTACIVKALFSLD